jgi:CHAD domain-containing protein
VGKTGETNAYRSRELVTAYLCTQIDELRTRESGARIDSPDAVHRMRVASRRLRSSLATFGPLFTGSQAQHLRDELLWLGVLLGAVRDVEVMRDHLHGTAAKLTVDVDLAQALACLDHELAQRHAPAHEDLVRALDGPRYGALIAALTMFVTDPGWIVKAAKRRTLPALVGRACARVDRAAEGALDVGSPELHELRKAAKRARYGAEVAAPSAGSPAHDLARRMEELQEVLGRHQDSVMARGLLRDLAARMPERQAYALGLLTGLEGASDESVLSEYRPALAAACADKVRDWTRR